MDVARNAALLLAVVLAAALSPAAAADGAEGKSCTADVAYIPGFLLANDPGAPDHLKHHGEKALKDAFDTAMAAASEAENDQACRDVIVDYLKAWRPGHLSVSPRPDFAHKETAPAPDADAKAIPAKDPDAPTIEWLSTKTVLITATTFHPAQEAAMDRLMKANRKRLDRTPYWIIDVRNNDGGSDSTYAPLVDAVMINDSFNVGAEFLSTPANIESTLRVCQIYAPGVKSCADMMDTVAERMRKAGTGNYVRASDDAPITRDPPSRRGKPMPAKVAVMIDKPCGSSCEQFLLAIRQSWNVKLVGRSTFGVLDYSNVRPHDLPSGKRTLWYATSRSLRLPYLSVDAAGIPPDIYLPKPADDAAFKAEVMTVKSLLEHK